MNSSMTGEMSLLEAIMNRRSYRGGYKPDKVPRKDLAEIMKAGLAAPSGCNKQTTSLIAVDDEALLTDYAVVLLGEGGEKFGFNLGYTVNRGDAIRVNLNRWVSLNELPVDTYTIYFVMNDQAYDVGCSVHIE